MDNRGDFRYWRTKLILSARRETLLKEVAQVCTENGAECMIVPLDLNKQEQIAKATQTIYKKYAHIDILINNAGISQRSYAKDVMQKIQP